jgi:hypothetical protein
MSIEIAPALSRVQRALAALHRALLETPGALLAAGLGCMALAASSDVANTFDSPRRGGPLIASVLFLTLVLAFAAFLAATRLLPPRSMSPAGGAARWARLLVYPVLLWALFTAPQTVGIAAHGLATSLSTPAVHYGSDDLYYNHFNALLVLRGENPYTGPWLAQEVAYFHDRAYTPLRRGRFADPRHYPTRAQMDAVVGDYLADPAHPPAELDPRTTHSYPAGAFLVNVPVVWAGIPSVALTQLLLWLALLAAIVWAAPARWRWMVALLLLAGADGARQVAGSDFEIWPLALVAFAWLTRERRWSSALLLGAACAIKQTAWIAAPFLLLWVWRRAGPAEAARRLALAAATFLAINLPWIIASPRAWLASLLLPVSLPLLPDGSGVIGLALTGVTPLAPSWVYGALEVLALAGALVWYWRRWPAVPFAGLVLPLVPLLVAWRSSERYFVLLPLAGVLAAVLTLRAARGEGASARAAQAADAGVVPSGAAGS